MAEKRMLSKSICDSDAFLSMPMSSQALYFHLNLRADDDGFVNNPKRITSYVGASEDDLKLLLVKRFILGFESGVIVIKHWRMHNTIQKDRYKPTDYQDEFLQLGLKPNKAYTLSSGNGMETDCIQSGNGMETQIRLDKKRIDKNRLDIAADADFEAFWVLYPRKVGKDAARKAFKKINVSVDVIKADVDRRISSKQWDDIRYIPYPATYLNGKRWEDEAEVLPAAEPKFAEPNEDETERLRRLLDRMST